MPGRGCNAKSRCGVRTRNGDKSSMPLAGSSTNGKYGSRLGWTPGDLFDVPRDGAMGLVWWLKSRTVTALGPEHACVGQPAYDRVTRREWIIPYSQAAP